MLFDVSYRRILAVGRSSVPSSVDLGQESSGAMVSADSFSKKVDLRVQRGGIVKNKENGFSLALLCEKLILIPQSRVSLSYHSFFFSYSPITNFSSY